MARITLAADTRAGPSKAIFTFAGVLDTSGTANGRIGSTPGREKAANATTKGSILAICRGR